MASMVGAGLEWTGELGSWIVWKLPADTVEDSESDSIGAWNVLREAGRDGTSTLIGAW
jgi:hypothetical protein